MPITFLDIVIVLVVMFLINMIFQMLTAKWERTKRNESYELFFNDVSQGVFPLWRCKDKFESIRAEKQKAMSYNRKKREFYIESDREPFAKPAKELEIKELTKNKIEVEGVLMERVKIPKVGGVAKCLRVSYHSEKYLKREKYYRISNYIFEGDDDTSIIGEDGNPCGVHPSFSGDGFDYYAPVDKRNN